MAQSDPNAITTRLMAQIARCKGEKRGLESRLHEEYKRLRARGHVEPVALRRAAGMAPYHPEDEDDLYDNMPV